MLRPLVHLHLVAVLAAERVRRRVDLAGERGQTSAEYALVLLGAASIALLVVLWARSTDQIGSLLDAIFGSIARMARE